eukprot:scaffold101_cov90-Isochrysis_galbana.AAC.3
MEPFGGFRLLGGTCSLDLSRRLGLSLAPHQLGRARPQLRQLGPILLPGAQLRPELPDALALGRQRDMRLRQRGLLLLVQPLEQHKLRLVCLPDAGQRLIVALQRRNLVRLCAQILLLLLHRPLERGDVVVGGGDDVRKVAQRVGLEVAIPAATALGDCLAHAGGVANVRHRSQRFRGPLGAKVRT